MARDDVGWAQLAGSISATILLVFALGGAWAQGDSPDAGAAHFGRPEPRLQILVHQGRLSVQLHEAELTEVLAEIRRQTGIAITGTPRSGSRLSTNFAGMPLDAGLRRLLRAASLSSAMIYAPGAAGAMALREVCLFGAGREVAPPPTVAEHDDTTSPAEAGPPFPAALADSSRAWTAPVGVADSEVIGHFRAMLGAVQNDSVPLGEDSELTRRLWVAWEGAQRLESPLH